PARRDRRRPAARRPVAEDRAPPDRGGTEADRLRVLQPDDARAQRRAARRGRVRPAPRPPGRHVPADAAHRVRRGAGPGDVAPPGHRVDRADYAGRPMRRFLILAAAATALGAVAAAPAAASVDPSISVEPRRLA